MKKIPLILIMFLVLGGSIAVESCKSKKTANTTEQSKPDETKPGNTVQVSDDQTLRSSVNDVVKDYNGVTAEVDNGVVTLKGTIQKDNLQNLIMKIQELKPKKVENKLVIK
jgi:hyperosmotically inducible periplasmic protein